MIVRAANRLFKQAIVVALLACLPITWFLIVGKLQIVQMLLEGEKTRALAELLTVSSHDALTATGASLVAGTLLYHQLPISIVPSFLPIKGKLDKTIAKLLGAAGIILLFIAQLSK